MKTSDENPCAPQPLLQACMKAGQMLMQHGAESALVENLTVRLGRALGAEQVHVGLTANFLAVTLCARQERVSDLRRLKDRGINMDTVSQVQRIVLKAEKNKGTQPDAVLRALETISPSRYPRVLVAVMVGLACGSFARLMGADWGTCFWTVAAAAIAMGLRLFVARFHFNPLLTFFVTAFAATSIAVLGGRFLPFVKTPGIAVAASVLLLIPGYPLINTVSDIVKGYVNTGLSRGTMAVLLILSSAMGMFLALTLMGGDLWK